MNVILWYLKGVDLSCIFFGRWGTYSCNDYTGVSAGDLIKEKNFNGD